MEVFARYGFIRRVEVVDLRSQLSELFRIAEEVKEERTEDRLRGIGSSDDDKVAIVDHDLERYFLFFCAEFVGLRRLCS